MVDECGNGELGVCFHLGNLRDVRGGITLGTWLAIGHFKLDVVGWIQGERLLVEQHNHASHVFLEILPVIVDLFKSEFVLLVRLVVHEVECVTLSIKELHISFLNIGRFERLTTLIGAIEDGAADQVSQFALVERVSFAWFDKVTFEHDVGIAVDLNFEPFSEIACIVVCHFFLPIFVSIAWTIMLSGMTIVASSNDSVPTTAISWQQAMKDAVRDPLELCRVLGLPESFQSPAQHASASFGTFVPPGYLAKITPGDPHDPLLRQVLPRGEEMEAAAGFTTDPIGEQSAVVHPGVLQKYQGRSLIVATGACAVHCRYCFRRHFPYQDGPKSPSAWEQAISGLAQDSSIQEVILSGGDPLTLTDPILADLVARLARIPHLKRLRIHTRLPIMIPQRVTDQMLSWLTRTRLVPVMVVHANHPREIDQQVSEALGRIVDAGVPTLNQAVLLRGVNDDVETLAGLSQRLLDCRTLPYYLHQLDPVAGAAHFHVSVEEGRKLIAELRKRLPGYGVPRYVQEQEGESSKTVLM